jgi:uridylate kinase
MTAPVLRVVLKLSGEALAGDGEFGIDPNVIRRIGRDVAESVASGVEVGIVIGGGNLFRGAELAEAGLNRVTGDQMGMLATVMNALAFRDALAGLGMKCVVLSAMPIPAIVEGYSTSRAIELLSTGFVVIFAGGTGNPFFTTDSAACLRGIEIGADLVLKATKVDGVYDADPVVNPRARRFEKLSYDEIIANDLRVMDLTAVCLCRDHQMPVVVFDMGTPRAVARIAAGERLGTWIESGSTASTGAKP